FRVDGLFAVLPMAIRTPGNPRVCLSSKFRDGELDFLFTKVLPSTERLMIALSSNREVDGAARLGWRSIPDIDIYQFVELPLLLIKDSGQNLHGRGLSAEGRRVAIQFYRVIRQACPGHNSVHNRLHRDGVRPLA